MDIKNIINDFLEKEGYLNDINVEGIVFYGSYQTKTNTNNSDIDLIIIYNNYSNKENIKAYKEFKGYNFEYFERTLKNIYDRVDNDYKNFEDTLYSAIGYGEILKDTNNNIEKLKDYILKKYENGLPKLNSEDKLYYLKSLKKAIEVLRCMNEEENVYFKIYYSLTLEKIRQYYHKINGFSNISSSKVLKLYTNEKIKEAQHKILPDRKFIELYIECIEKIEYRNILELFNYVIRDLSKEIDFNNIKLKLGNKNH